MNLSDLEQVVVGHLHAILHIANEIPVGLKDIVLVYYQHLPCILVNTMLHSNIILLLTNEESIITRRRYYESPKGITTQNQWKKKPRRNFIVEGIIYNESPKRIAWLKAENEKEVGKDTVGKTKTY